MEPTKVYVDKRDTSVSPDLMGRKECILKDGLKDGSKVRRLARLTQVRDRNTGKHHHDALTIKTIALSKQVCTVDSPRSVTLGGEETERLTAFLGANGSGAVPDNTGGYLVVPTRGGPVDAMRALRDLTTPDRLDALAMLLKEAAEKPAFLGELVARMASDTDYLERAAAAMNLAVYRQVLSQLVRLVESPGTREKEFQTLLESQPWLLGSEYSAILDRRRWTRDEIADFVPRRTTDGWLELIEIKTTLDGQPLFVQDRSHNTLYAGAELSKVTAQVQNYLERLDRDRDRIKANDNEDFTKTRARIIIGRDGAPDQQEALRRYNGHLHRIEVMTFDGLMAVARRLVSYLEAGQEINDKTGPQ